MIEGVYGKTKPPVCLKGDNKAEDLKGSIVGILNFTLQSCSVDFLKPAGADSFTRLTPLIPSTGAFLLRILFANSLGLNKDEYIPKGKASFSLFKIEILSGLTVAIALVPEAIAFAFVAGVTPLSGLYAAFIVGLVTAIFGGRQV